MGSKITIDCATLMNKSLELIEAYWLFGLREDQLGMIVHPQSIVHAMVETTEGAVLAQMSAPDMRAPLQFALTHPRRVAPLAPPLDLSRLSRLEFLPVDTRRFPAAGLWTSALGERANTTAGAILNAANEEAVLAFLGHPGEVAFTRIADVVMEAVESVERCPAGTLDDILAAGSAAREFVRRRLSGRSPASPATSPLAR